MAHKHLLFRSEARDKVLPGATAIADAVRVTLGPRSKCVLIEKKWGMPIVCNDDPPMNELVVDGVNGLLVPSQPDGLANSGIPAKTVDVPGLTRAISRLADPGLRAELSAGALATREERNWEATVRNVAELLG